MKLEITWPPKFVRLHKMAESPNPVVPATAAADYPYGLCTYAGSLPVGYTVVGWLVQPPRVGEPVRILRFARDGMIILGLFASSEVLAIPREGEFTTLNSVYYWQEIAAPTSPMA